MTRKQEQLQENQIVERWIEKYNSVSSDDPWLSEEKLDYCTATVIRTKHYKILRSYATIVAVIDLESGIGYDFLRYVYGYTNTSAKHISKFFHYNATQMIFTWRPV